MKIDAETTLEQFREEMQHRVVKYPLNSRPVKEALRFAKTHEDPAFYRIASDKIHAQRQFQRELYGPGRFERLVDFMALGSLREVVVTLVLVAIGVAGLDGVRRWSRPEPIESAVANLDLDTLAKRLGIALETNRLQVIPNEIDGMRFEGHDANTTQHSDNLRKENPRRADAESAQSGSMNRQLTDEDVARIADAIIARMNRPNTLEIDVPNKAQTISLDIPESGKSTNLADNPATTKAATDVAPRPDDRPIAAAELTAESKVIADKGLEGADEPAASGKLAAGGSSGAAE